MIGRITGVLLEMRPPQLIVDCNGVGYEIEAPMTTIWALPEMTRKVSLYTHPHGARRRAPASMASSPRANARCSAACCASTASAPRWRS